MSIETSEKNIKAFLYFGWLPRLDKSPHFSKDWIPEKKLKSEDFSTKKGADILRKAVTSVADKNQKNIVPLSGGLDSRVVLAILKELKYDILAVTVGVPGTFDYDIGQLVARKLGVEQKSINLNEVELETNELVEMAREIDDWVNIIEIYYNLIIPKMFPGKPIIAGLLGDFLAGEYANKTSGSWEEALNNFGKRSKTFHLVPENFDFRTVLPKSPSISGLNFYEELIFLARHTCTLRPNVFARDYGYLLPFNNKGWVEYILSAPRELRVGKRLYEKILAENWPEAFDLPCKNEFGVPITASSLSKKFAKQRTIAKKYFLDSFPYAKNIFGINPMTNYVDFEYAGKKNPSLRRVLEKNIYDLDKRNILDWIDVKKIWKTYIKHDRHPGFDMGKTLSTLTNLEINLKAQDKRQ